MAAQCLISLGANVGDRARAIEQALRALSAHPEVQAVRCSRLRATRPAGGPGGQAHFLNAAAVLQTSLPPAALLALLMSVEAGAGRRRDVRWGPRPLDLDLLLYDDVVLTGPSLRLPHPRMAWRRFVLEPAAEIAPDMMHPSTGWSVARLLAHLNTTPYYLAITGSIGAGKTELAGRLAARPKKKLKGNAGNCEATGSDGILRSQSPSLPMGGTARLIAEEIDLSRLEAFYADPASRAWTAELEFLKQRKRLLARGAEVWRDPSRPVVSDFWFDQSAAFASVWLGAEEYSEFAGRFEAARQTVVRPRLVVLLESAGQELRERVLRRGRDCERGLTADQLDRIAQAIDRQTRCPDVGPVLRIGSEVPDATLEEVRGAILAMA